MPETDLELTEVEQLAHDHDLSSAVPQSSLDYTAGPNPTIIGDTITNPYCIRIARQAYKRLSTKAGFNMGGVKVLPTNLYVIFRPRNADDERAIAAQISSPVFDIPLDRLVSYQGDGYRDPAVQDGVPTYLYTVVSADQDWSKISVPYQVLDTLFQPDYVVDGKTVFEVDAFKAVEVESYAIAKSKSPDFPEYEFKPAYTPIAEIRYLDDDGVLRGLEGARITMKQFTRTGNAITNAAGVAISDKSFTLTVKYKLHWERERFEIRDGPLNKAVINGPEQRERWIFFIDVRGDSNWRRAQVHRGAYRYHYQDILGLQRPPSNQLRYRVVDEIDDDRNGRHCAACSFLFLGSTIKIWVPRDQFRRRAQDYMGTTIHEAAHAAHRENERSNLSWLNIQERVSENWARGAQFALTRLHYPTYRPTYFQTYTGLVEDLMDANATTAPFIFRDPNNPNASLNGTPGTDGVSGYSIIEIQNAAFRGGTYEEWRENLRSSSPNPTSGNLDALFDFWANIPAI